MKHIKLNSFHLAYSSRVLISRQSWLEIFRIFSLVPTLKRELNCSFEAVALKATNSLPSLIQAWVEMRMELSCSSGVWHLYFSEAPEGKQRRSEPTWSSWKRDISALIGRPKLSVTGWNLKAELQSSVSKRAMPPRTAKLSFLERSLECELLLCSLNR